MSVSHDAPHSDQIFAYRGRSTARATAIRRHPPEGCSHLPIGSNCNLLTKSVLIGSSDLATNRRNAV